jgi:hypothetical protein
VASSANVFDPKIPHLAINYDLADVLFPSKGHGLRYVPVSERCKFSPLLRRYEIAPSLSLY